MKFNKYQKIILTCFFIVFLILIVGYFIFSKALRAQEQVSSFCREFGISTDHFEQTNSFVLPNESRGLISSTSIHPSCGDVAVTFSMSDTYGNSFPRIYFILGRWSNEIEGYSNGDIYFELRHKYRTNEGDSKDINWPPFMPQSETKKIIDTLAAKLLVPTDMVLQEIRRDEKIGILTAVWRRVLNGYLYENDKATVTIMGATGEFVEYVKHYEGRPCPTVVNISEAEALKRGWERFVNKAVPEELRSRAHLLYSADVSLRIVQPSILGRFPIHINSKNSRLAWIVSFSFTGGIDLKESKHPTEAELDASSTALGMRESKWYELGKPQRSFEIRYDAETGSILEMSLVEPAWSRWMVK